MLRFDPDTLAFIGPAGTLSIRQDDEIARQLAMLIEGHCLGLGGAGAARKHGYCKQRYSQLLGAFGKEGTAALRSARRGPKRNYRRTDEVVRQVIRHRFLHPEASVEVIAQKLQQNGFPISIRSVRRVIEGYGLQKKTLRLPAHRSGAGH
jgi:transposase